MMRQSPSFCLLAGIEDSLDSIPVIHVSDAIMVTIINQSIYYIINHMAITRKTIDAIYLTKLLRDPVVIKIVTALDVVSLSTLELLEYGILRKDVSQALADEIIIFDKSALVHSGMSSNFPLTEQDIITSGDYYFYNFLNSKVKLTDVKRKIRTPEWIRLSE